MAVSPSDIELALDELKRNPYSPASFFFGFLEAHDAPKATISKIRNSSDPDGTEFIWPRKLAFRSAAKGDILQEFEKAKVAHGNRKNAPRFVLVADGVHISGYDSVADESWHDDFSNLNSHFNMTLPLAGLERYRSVDENPADIKAAGRLAKFYDAILEANPSWSGLTHRHELNLFMTRVLFCMFAEDTHIIPEDIFTRTIDQNTRADGADVSAVLTHVFRALDVKQADRSGFPSYVDDFPYVNGGLFREITPVPNFSRRARSILIDACHLNWSEINPDIFGSMIQGVVDEKKRGELGMHYTSVPNIMKLIGPLFLDTLKSEFEQAGNNVGKLQRLLSKLHRIRIFDPACGSGNFLIISYREIRRLEMAIFQKLQQLSKQSMLPMSQIRLSQFYGIEYTDFAAETAKLALWIAEYQANKEFEAVFGTAPPVLPLKDAGRIVCGNALRVSWSDVCDPSVGHEVFIVGNPPYLGRAKQSAEQKEDMILVYGQDVRGFAKLDYVTAWIWRACHYYKQANVVGDFSFVVTNSVCQGEQVFTLWPHVMAMGFEISFAHAGFKWANSAAKKAGVTCSIIGISNQAGEKRRLFTDDAVRLVTNINPYLIAYENVYVKAKRSASDSRPTMSFGSMPNDDGNLILNRSQKEALEANHPAATKFIRRLYGSQEYNKGIERWCIWVDPGENEAAETIAPLKARFDAVRSYREDSDREATRALANVPYRFGEVRQEPCEHVIIVPSVYSEKRQYVPCGLLTSAPIVTNLAFAVFDGPIWLLGLLMTKLHAVWIKTVCGQLETRIRYSNTLGYNTFPLVDLSPRQRQMIEDDVWRIMEQREAASDMNIGKLYDAKTMPDELRAAHQALDETVEKIYRGRLFRDDTERVEHLFNLYVLQNGDTSDETDFDSEVVMVEEMFEEDA